ncbi:hypothetical protein AAC691_12940 [Nguyenibacter vanlangensis]|uniref:ABC transporter permease n=1 Tax=Nguyenibacter vanlangensis TaxID=1216886 RepID=A0ABZ3D114_9PROT
MAEHAHSVPRGARTRANRVASHWQDIVPALLFPFLVLIALVGFARPEVLRHSGAKLAHAPLVLAEGGR